MSVPRVHLLYEHGEDLRPYGCAHIRLLLPFSHPAVSSQLAVSSGTQYRAADVIILQRLWRPSFALDEAERLLERVHRDGARLVYEIDDSLLDLEPEPPLGDARHITAEAQMVIRFLAREADAVMVSTPALGDRMQGLNPRIFVVPNALDERLFAPPRPAEGAVRGAELRVVGFMGTHTHDADLMMILQPLRQVLRSFAGRVRLEIVGGMADTAVAQALAGLPATTLNPGSAGDYPAFVGWMQQHLAWDLALGPLEDTRFNRSKSDLKFLDYSALGFAGIYSRVTSYAGTVSHLSTGYLASESPDEWADGLERLLGNDALREGLAESAQCEVFSRRTLEHCAGQWREVVLAVLDGSRGARTEHTIGERVQ